MPHCNNPSKFSFLCQYMGDSLDLFRSFFNHWLFLLVHFVKCFNRFLLLQSFWFSQYKTMLLVLSSSISILTDSFYHFNIWNRIISIAININLGAQINFFQKCRAVYCKSILLMILWSRKVGVLSKWVTPSRGINHVQKHQDKSLQMLSNSWNISMKAYICCQIHD
jgi:hypothetical protein